MAKRYKWNLVRMSGTPMLMWTSYGTDSTEMMYAGLKFYFQNKNVEPFEKNEIEINEVSEELFTANYNGESFELRRFDE